MDIINEKETSIKKDVASIRSIDHQAYTYVQNKVALTGFYDKMRTISNIDSVPYGFNPL